MALPPAVTDLSQSPQPCWQQHWTGKGRGMALNPSPTPPARVCTAGKSGGKLPEVGASCPEVRLCYLSSGPTTSQSWEGRRKGPPLQFQLGSAQRVGGKLLRQGFSPQCGSAGLQTPEPCPSPAPAYQPRRISPPPTVQTLARGWSMGPFPPWLPGPFPD